MPVSQSIITTVHSLEEAASPVACVRADVGGGGGGGVGDGDAGVGVPQGGGWVRVMWRGAAGGV